MAALQNDLIGMLPRVDRARLLIVCRPVQLVLSEVLFNAGEPAAYVYFPSEGFVSLVTPVDSHAGLEVGMVGREGLVGVQVALGVLISPVRALVQGAGMAQRISAEDFQEALAQTPVLQQIIHRYLHVLMNQLATSALCLRFHPIAPRLARWLLMSHDRAGRDSFHVTQEFMAYMLGVRRVGVTAAAGQLQSGGLIAYHRGDLTVLDRTGLEAVACSCYRADRRAYSDVMTPV